MSDDHKISDLDSDGNLTKNEAGNRVDNGASSLFYLALITAMFLLAVTLLPNNIGLLFFAYIIAISSLIYFHSEADVKPRRFGEESSSNSAFGKVNGFQTALAEGLLFPAFILDGQGRIQFVNSASKNAFGDFSSAEQIFIRFRQPELRRLIEESLTSQRAMVGEYNEPVPNDRWFAVEIAPIPSTRSNPSELLFILGFHDLTESKRTDQMRSDFIANASHELRTPLAALLGYIETIKGPARRDDKAFDRFTDIMMDQAQRMTRLVNDLLSLSSIEMKSHVRPSNVIDLSELIASVIDPLQSVAQALDVEIKFNTPGKTHIVGDYDELLQVFQNLIENACKYGQEGKKVVVSIEHDKSNHQAIASVQDFGPGIAIEHQQRITERFYRVDVASSMEKQGTGLGLAIVKHILNRHATKLGIESSVDGGSTFFIKFPFYKKTKK